MLLEKKSILFVDDDQQILDSLRVALRRERRRWGMRFFAGAEQALMALKEEPADLIVTDMRMPCMDGAEFLERVACALPRSVRIVLSGEAEESLAVSAIPFAHQWLSKPTEASDLVRVFERALAVSELTHDSRAHEIVTSVAKLPVLPQVYQALTKALRQEEVCLDEVCGLVEQQPSVSARVLQMSNSAFFGLPRPMGNIREAVGFLGLETIKNLVVSAEIICELGPTSGGFSMGDFLVESVATSRIAGQIMGHSPGAETAVSAGLLHDIGRLVLLQSGALGKQYARDCQGAAEPVWIEAEKQLFGATHADVGGALLGVWGLPNDLVEAVAHHHDPDALQCNSLEPAVAVHIARAIVSVERDIAAGRLEADAATPISPGSSDLIAPSTMEEFRLVARDSLQTEVGAD